MEKWKVVLQQMRKRIRIEDPRKKFVETEKVIRSMIKQPEEFTKQKYQEVKEVLKNNQVEKLQLSVKNWTTKVKEQESKRVVELLEKVKGVSKFGFNQREEQKKLPIPEESSQQEPGKALTLFKSINNGITDFKKTNLEKISSRFEPKHGRADDLIKSMKNKLGFSDKKLSFSRTRRQVLFSLLGISVGSMLYRYIKAPFRFIKYGVLASLLGSYYLQMKYYQKISRLVRKMNGSKDDKTEKIKTYRFEKFKTALKEFKKIGK